VGRYIDAYASAIPSTVIGTQHMLNMKTAVIVKNPMRRLFLLGTGIISVMAILLLIGISIPFIAEQRVKREYRDLTYEESQVAVIVAKAPSVEKLEKLRNDVYDNETRIRGINAFYTEFAQASAVVPILFGAEVLNINRYDKSEGFSKINTVDVKEDEIQIDATAIHFDHVAGLMEYFRSFIPEWEQPKIAECEKHIDSNCKKYHTLFITAGAASVNEKDTMNFQNGTAEYVFDMIMRREMGER
jgi:hypothetical protein